MSIAQASIDGGIVGDEGGDISSEDGNANGAASISDLTMRPSTVDVFTGRRRLRHVQVLPSASMGACCRL